jgi:hypothetical protein
VKTIKQIIVLSFFIVNFCIIPVHAFTYSEVSLVRSDYAQEYYANFLKVIKIDNRFSSDIAAGAFLDENFDLHILVKGDKNTVNLLMEEFSINESVSNLQVNVFIEQVRYSDNEILEAYQAIIDFELGNKGLLNGVNINYKINGLDIEYVQSKISSTDLLSILKSVLGDFVNLNLVPSTVENVVEEKSSLYGGEEIRGKLGTVPKSCSIGFAASTFDHKYGFVTAGHCFSLNTPVSYNNGVMVDIGDVTVRKYEPTVDAEFVKLRSIDGFSAPNTAKWLNTFFPYSTYIKTRSERPLQGSLLTVYGYHGKYNSVLISNCATIYFNFFTSSYQDVLSFNSVVEEGDSGGVIISSGLAVGIVRGTSGLIDYGTPADTIVIKLGLAY